jgi:hypothetical protein
MPGLTLNDMRTVPLLTRATLLAMLCAGAVAAAARAAKAITPAFATEILRVVIC